MNNENSNGAATPAKLTSDTGPVSPAPQRRGFLAPRRNSVASIGEDGSHRKLYPADVSGRFTRARQISALALMLIYLLLPWIKVGGYPAVFLDVGLRRFHLFGWTLAAQDMWLMFFGISGLGFLLFFLTSLLGRVWCGWACPQTIFLEHLFRRFERTIEGDAPRRRALDRAAWGVDKIVRRLVKHVVFILFSAGIAHLFLAYFVSIPELWTMMRTAPGEHWGSFVFILAATGGLYFNFAWFREQMCIVLCPYGRMQSALIDDHSLVIGYDQKRGEPRGKLGVPDAGACVDCNRCVQVCPTGIDIRHGLQIECIGCAACIDVCDEVMTRIHRPTGLIRYDSAEGLAGRRTQWLRPRILVYSILLFAGAGISAWAFSTVKPADASITRMRGAPYFVEPASLRNQYLLRLVNKRTEPAVFEVAAETLPQGASTTGLGRGIEVAALGEEVRPFVIVMDRPRYTGSFHFRIRVTDTAGGYEAEREVEFLGPDPELLKEDGNRHEEAK